MRSAIPVLLAVLSAANAVHAHGLNGHTLVTDGAIEFMSDSALLDLLDDPEVRNAFAMGAVFPDSGYSPSVQRYGEPPHWEPFAEAQLAYLREHFQPPYDLEARKIIAFNLGSICHGMEDEIYDTLFELNSDEQGDVADRDTGLDVLLVVDGHRRVVPEFWAPMETMHTIYNDYYGEAVPQAEIERGLFLAHNFALEIFHAIAPGLQEDNRYDLNAPWAHANFMNPATPSSFPHEMTLVGPYADALWKRFQGTFSEDDLLVGQVPAAGERLRSVRHGTVDSWTTLYFGIGVEDPSIATRVGLFDSDGNQIETQTGHTRWSNGQGSSRLVRIMPTVDLEYNTVYEARIEPGIKFVNGVETQREYRVKILTPCPPDQESCPDPEAKGGDSGSGCATSGTPTGSTFPVLVICLLAAWLSSRIFGGSPAHRV